ncbi:MAG: hypothetical protein R3F34_17850 [Planctomycetota bacterium]
MCATCALGTPIVGYGSVLCGLPLALLAASGGVLARLAQRHWLAGASLGLAAACEPSASVLLVALVPARGFLRYVAGAAIPVAAHLAAHRGAYGTFFGFPEGSHGYPLSFFDLGALVAGPDPWTGPWWESWFGPRGAVARFPALLLGAYGLVVAARRGAPLARPLLAAALVLAALGSVPERLPFGMVASEHVLLLPALVVGGARLRLRRGPSIAIAAALLLVASVPGAVFAWRSPLRTWHLSASQTARARLGVERPAEHTPVVVEEWERARLVRDTSRTFLAGEFEQRLRLLASSVVDRGEPTVASLERMRDGLQTIVDRLDRAGSPEFARPLSHWFLGRTFLALGDEVRAEASFRACIALYPRFDEARDALEALGVPVTRGS